MNLAPVVNYGTEFPFIDRMKMSDGWSAFGVPIPVDAHGNPTSVPAGMSMIATVIPMDPVSAAPTDIYELTWSGTATFAIGVGTILSSQPGKIVFRYTGANDGTMMNLIIKSIAAADPVHDIHVVRQDLAAAFANGAMFNPEFLSQVSNWQTLRYMDWEATNGTTITSWDQRTHVDDVSWAQKGNSSGVPIEIMIRLANESHADLWFNIPTRADDTYVRNALQMIKDQLAPGLKVHVEYSNEVWNTGFKQSQYAQTMANRLWGKDVDHNGVIDPNNAAEAVARGDQVYYGYRSAQVAAIANSVFSGGDDDRLAMVFATQTGNNTLEKYWLDGIAKAKAGSVGSLFDELAGGAYFGSELMGNTSADQAKVIAWAKSGAAGITAALDELMHGGAGLSAKGSIDEVAPYLKYEASVAARYGLDFVAYEGGFHGTALYYGANQPLIQDFLTRLLADPRMEDVYTYWLNTFKAAGGTMVAAFNDVQKASNYGSFGSLDTLYDAKSPRYEALLDFAGTKALPVALPVIDTLLKTALGTVVLDAAHKDLTFIGAGAFSGSGNAQDNSITGGAGADTLYGYGGKDRLIGGGGADRLDGGDGTDTMIGGAGNDTYIVDNAGDIVTEKVGEGTDEVRTALGSYTLGANVENLTHLGTTAFTGIGNALDNVLVGGGGIDRLEGGDGADTLDGRAGGDQMIGGAGNDTYLVDDKADGVTELAGGGTDEVRTTLASYALGANVENLTYLGSADFTGRGNALANVLTGGAGNDTLDGGLGADRMIGGAGNDTYYVNDTGDVIVELAGRGTDAVSTSVNYTLAANIENLTMAAGATIVHGNDLANIIREYVGGLSTYTLYGEGGNDSMLGSDAIDILYGGTGNDSMSAGGGNDVLVGGAGNDWLNGGKGADRFVFSPGDSGTGGSADMIVDFSRAEGDRIDLRAFDANAATAAHDPLRFIGSAAFTRHAGELRVAAGSIQVDTNGDGVVDFAISHNGGVLIASDFLL
jgi:Ca2+-binding RTX toxin-like protein